MYIANSSELKKSNLKADVTRSRNVVWCFLQFWNY